MFTAYRFRSQGSGSRGTGPAGFRVPSRFGLRALGLVFGEARMVFSSHP